MGLFITKFEFTGRRPSLEDMVTRVFEKYHIHLEVHQEQATLAEESDKLIEATETDSFRASLSYPTICDITTRKLRRYGSVNVFTSESDGRRLLDIWFEPFDRSHIIRNMLFAILPDLGGVEYKWWEKKKIK
ncbi:hypothetical protein [Hymenobacter cellulosilyticus]|uniref:Uncharacterized protein n=1 Tax=Hymenobacter cellulosilyticus TaxID=2932248 RepID=A0A8T9Q147_9BACT|nr:hypothetical protein [Hymenobacter cellulosilyticus]UOQ71184.1 hypothetical protein MUN79_21380 [Hymenobacter cellulosilyticus]